MDSDRATPSLLPRIVYWYGLPDFFEEQERFDLLKNDLFIRGFLCPMEEFKKLIGADIRSRYFLIVNIDAIYYKFHADTESPGEFIQKMIAVVAGAGFKNAVLYTGHDRTGYSSGGLREKKIELQATEGFLKKRTIVEHSLNVIRRATREAQTTRTYVRTPVYPQRQLRVSVTLTIHEGIVVDGFLKDISLNGMGILLSNRHAGLVCSLDDEVAVELVLPHEIINLKKAIIRRVDPREPLIGVTFDVGDPEVITAKHAKILVATVLEWLGGMAKEFLANI